GPMINMSSFVGHEPAATPGSYYSAAKAAHENLNANLRVAFRRRHPYINVSLIMPGLPETDRKRHAYGSTGAVPTGASGWTMKTQAAEEVAGIVADVMDHPVPELYTNTARDAVAARYFADVALFESEAESWS